MPMSAHNRSPDAASGIREKPPQPDYGNFLMVVFLMDCPYPIGFPEFDMRSPCGISG